MDDVGDGSMNISLFYENFNNETLLCDNFKIIQSSVVLRLADAIREQVRTVKALIGI